MLPHRGALWLEATRQRIIHLQRLTRRKTTDAERSGINGAGTSTQKAKGITDSGEIFLADTLKGGAKKPEVAKVTAAEIQRLL